MTVFDRYRRWIDDYVDGELDAERAGNFTHHLESCAECKREVAQKRQLKQLLKRQHGDASVPQSLQSKLLSAKVVAPEYHYDVPEEPARSRAFAPMMACMTALVLLTGALFAAWSVGGSAANARTEFPQLANSWSETPQPLSATDVAGLRRDGWNLASLDFLGLHFDKAQARKANGVYEVTMNFVKEASATRPAVTVSVVEQRSHETSLESASLQAAERPGSRMASADKDPNPHRIVRNLQVSAAQYTVDIETGTQTASNAVTPVSNDVATLAGQVLDRLKTTDQGRLQFVERQTDPWNRVVDGLRRLVGVS